VHTLVCTHHIYIKEGCKLVRQPQRKLNPTLKDFFKEELQKLIDAGFIVNGSLHCASAKEKW